MYQTLSEKVQKNAYSEDNVHSSLKNIYRKRNRDILLIFKCSSIIHLYKKGGWGQNRMSIDAVEICFNLRYARACC